MANLEPRLDPESEQSRRASERPGEQRRGGRIYDAVRQNSTSIRMLLLIAGVGAFLVGALVFIFVRQLATSGLITMGVGLGLLAIDAIISWRQVGRAVFGRRGRYGANTVLIVVAFIALATVLNWFIFWMGERPNPPEWLRADMTANQQFGLSPQAQSVLNDLSEDIRVNVFMVRDTPEGAAAWRDTQDLLSEFQRRSGGRLEFRHIDPELRPNLASEYNVTSDPALAIEAMESRRTEVVNGSAPADGPNIFTEQQVTTGLLVVDEQEQKQVYFISGHGERSIADEDPEEQSYISAAEALFRDNYQVRSGTLNDLFIEGVSGTTDLPAALVFADPSSDLVEGGPNERDETVILRNYLRQGGSVLFLFEPDPPQSFVDVLGDYGITVGEGHLVDGSSFVAPDPTFLQLTQANRQFQQHPITEPLDVVYMPASTFVGRTVRDEEIPTTEDGELYLELTALATTSVNSWEETGEEEQFDPGTDRSGPLPVGVAVNALAPLGGNPRTNDEGEPIRTRIVVMGDSDFASDRYFASAKNGDLFANSVNWLAEDFELISIRPKTEVFRELVLTQTEREFVRWSGWLLMPVLVGGIGVWTWWRRR